MRTPIESQRGSESTASFQRPVEARSGPLLALTNAPWLKTIVVSIAIATTCLLYYGDFHPEKFGFYRDDGIYVVMAKALATGQGYHVISLPSEPAQAKSPPFFPLLLSLVWRAYPHFPENLTLMVLLSIISTVSFLAISYQYLVKQHYCEKWKALLVVAFVAINWRVIVLATGIYSEMVYAALALAGLYLIERYEQEEKNWVLGMISGIVVGLAFLTRSSGIALFLAIGLYFLLRRAWRKGILPLATGSILVIGWIAWGYLNNNYVESVNAGSYESYLQTFNELVNNAQAQGGTSKAIILLTIIGKNALGLILLSVPVVCLGSGYEWVQYFGFAFIFIAAGFIRQLRKGLRLLHIYVMCYLAIHLLWPYSSYDRFLIPLLPFLLLYLVNELETMGSLVRKELKSGGGLVRRISAGFIAIALFVAVGITLYNYGSEIYWRLASASLKKVAAPASEDVEAMEWIKTNTDPSDVLVCYRDPLYNLYTGRKATRSSLSRAGDLIQSYESTPDERAKVILRIVTENNARYMIVTPTDFDLEYRPILQREGLQGVLELYPRIFVPAFKSTDGHSTVYRIENNGHSNSL